MNIKQAKVRADVFKALCNPVRIQLVDALLQGDRCVQDLVAMNKINQSNISRHLGVLKKVGILTDRREGMRVLYHLQTPCILRAFDCALEVIRAEHVRRTEAVKGERP